VDERLERTPATLFADAAVFEKLTAQLVGIIEATGYEATFELLSAAVDADPAALEIPAELAGAHAAFADYLRGVANDCGYSLGKLDCCNL
jgi:hypothetical protein